LGNIGLTGREEMEKEGERCDIFEYKSALHPPKNFLSLACNKSGARSKFSYPFVAVLFFVLFTILYHPVLAQSFCQNTAHYTEDFVIDYGYSICGVPDLDQRRESSLDPFIVGLPNLGVQYCVPTSALNWMAFIANHGYPDVRPGPGNWQLGPPDFPDIYNEISFALLTMGSLMETDPITAGTGANNARQAMQDWLDEYAPGQFIVSWKGPNQANVPTMQDVAELGISGDLVMIAVGWYTDADDNTKPHIRGGGHIVSVVGANRFGGGTPSISIHDPNSPSDGLLQSQSTFTRDTYDVIDVTGSFGYTNTSGIDITFPRKQSRVVGYGSGYIDEIFSIKPKFGITLKDTLIIFMGIVDFLDIGEPTVKDYEAVGNVIDAEINPLLPRHPYLVDGSNFVWQLNTLTGQSQELATVRNPKKLLYGGPEQNLYVLTDEHVISLDQEGQVNNRIDAMMFDAISFDNQQNQLVAVQTNGHSKLYTYDADLSPLKTYNLDGFKCKKKSKKKGRHKTTDISMSIDPTDGSAWLHCDRSKRLYRVWINGHDTYSERDSDFESDSDSDADSDEIKVIKIVLKGAKAPVGLFVDDKGNIFFSDDGLIVEYDQNGNRVEGSRFSGYPSQKIVKILRPFSNYDPQSMTGPSFYNVLPPDRLPPPR
jgi:hypothetical protein